MGSEINNKNITNKNLLNICKKIGSKLNYGDLVILRGTVQVGLGQKLLVPLLKNPLD